VGYPTVDHGPYAMRFKVVDARRVLRFCLDRSFDIELSDEGTRVMIRVSPVHEGLGPPRRFDGETFEEALRAAADAGMVRKECIERQIAFIRAAGERIFDAKAGKWTGPALSPCPEQPQPATPEPVVAASDGSDLRLAHYRGLAELRYQMRRFVSFSEREARQAGLEPPQHQLLLAIHGLPPSKRPDLATLAERMCMDPAQCEPHLRVLVDRGLVRWTANPSDRRQQLAVITEPGLTLLARLTSLHRNQILAVGPTFVQALGSILSSFEDAD
jgi:DNA-binding MarR family transcriptional regulator